MNGFLMFLIAIDAVDFNTNEQSSGYKIHEKFDM